MLSGFPYEFDISTKIIFGQGTVKRVGEELKNLGCKKVLVVTDPGIASMEFFTDAITSILENSIVYSLFKEVEAEPSTHVVENAFDQLRQEGCDTVLAIGGGSSIDTAKGVAVLATNPGNLKDFSGFGKFNIPPIPLVAIPTTAGTGSEVSDAAAITDKEKNEKFSIRHKDLNRAKIAILDPNVLRSLPTKIAVITGMDALSHAIESYTSIQANPFTEALSLYAIQLIGENFRSYVSNRNDTEAAGKMLIASSMSALGFTFAGTGYVHCVARYIGAQFHIAHGMLCAVTLPYIAEFNYIANPAKFAKIAQALGEHVEGLSLLEAAKKSIIALRKLCDDLGIPRTLGELGVPFQAVDRLAEDCANSWYHKFNPRYADKDEFEHLLSKMITASNILV